TVASTVQGLRHYNGNMTPGNTPDSILWGNSKSRLILNGTGYGNIRSLGNGAEAVDNGFTFIGPGLWVPFGSGANAEPWPIVPAGPNKIGWINSSVDPVGLGVAGTYTFGDM